MITARLGLQQRVLPIYRVPFFQALGANCVNGLGIFAGEPRHTEMVENRLSVPGTVVVPAHNIHLLSGPFYFCWQAGLMRWLESWQPEALILEANPRYLHSSKAVRWMHRRRRPVIGWGLGAPEISGPFAQQQIKARRRFILQFDALLTYSALGKEQYAAEGFDPSRIFIARNAAAPRPASMPPARPDQFDAGVAAVLYVGRLQPRKRIDLLIRACAALPHDRQTRLWIVGDGPQRAELEALAGSIYPSAQFFGTLYGTDLDARFDQADLFVLPGTGGLAVQQAMTHALPIVVAEGDGTQSDLLRPENGWAVTPGSQEDMLRVLSLAISDPPRLRQMGLASYRIVAEEVNLENMVAAFEKAVNSII